MKYRPLIKIICMAAPALSLLVSLRPASAEETCGPPERCNWVTLRNGSKICMCLLEPIRCVLTPLPEPPDPELCILGETLFAGRGGSCSDGTQSLPYEGPMWSTPDGGYSVVEGGKLLSCQPGPARRQERLTHKEQRGFLFDQMLRGLQIANAAVEGAIGAARESDCLKQAMLGGAWNPRGCASKADPATGVVSCACKAP